MTKVISSLNTVSPAASHAQTDVQNTAQTGSTGTTASAAGTGSTTTTHSGSGASADKGTNIAITTATDQHINIWVPENPNAKVTVKKTEGVKIVESDSDKVDKNAEIKKAIGDKIRGELVKKALKGEEAPEGDNEDAQKLKSAA